MIGTCENCKRTGRGLKQHHMVPRIMGGSDLKFNRILLCSLCEAWLHTTYSKEYLAENMNTREKILSDKAFVSFGNFINKNIVFVRHKNIKRVKKLFSEAK